VKKLARVPSAATGPLWPVPGKTWLCSGRKGGGGFEPAIVRRRGNVPENHGPRRKYDRTASGKEGKGYGGNDDALRLGRQSAPYQTETSSVSEIRSGHATHRTRVGNACGTRGPTQKK